MLLASQQNQELLVLFCSLLVGVLFLISGAGKLVNQKKFVAVVRNFELLPESTVTFVGHLLPYCEIILGTAVLLNVYATLFLGLAIVLLTSFALAVSINLIRGRSYISCGCFGSFDNSQLTWSLVIRNLVLIGIAFFATVTSGAGDNNVLERFMVAASIGALITAYHLSHLIMNLWKSQFSLGQATGTRGRAE